MYLYLHMDQIPVLERQLNALKTYYGYDDHSKSYIPEFVCIFHGMLVITFILIVFHHLKDKPSHQPVYALYQKNYEHGMMQFNSTPFLQSYYGPSY